MPKSELLLSLFAQSLFKKNDFERFAPVSLYKRAPVSDSFPSLMTKEHGSDSLFITSELHVLLHGGITLSLTENERFAQKTDEQIIPKGKTDIEAVLLFKIQLIYSFQKLPIRRFFLFTDHF